MTTRLGSRSLKEPHAGLSVGLREFLNWFILVKSNESGLGVQNVRTSFPPEPPPEGRGEDVAVLFHPHPARSDSTG